MGKAIYRVEGEALSGAPDLPNAPGTATCVSTSALDTGQLYLEIRKNGFAFDTVTIQLDGTNPVEIPSVFRVNRAYYIHPDGPEGGGTDGTVTVTVGGKVLATIAVGGVSAWDCVYSIEPGLATAALINVTPGVIVKHRLGQSPFSVTVVDGGQVPGFGDFWAEGTGFCQFELEHQS